jgi:hypothetical protein
MTGFQTIMASYIGCSFAIIVRDLAREYFESRNKR